MVDPTTAALRAIRLYGPLALCLFTFLETSMLFPFLPSEVVVPAAAALLVTDVPSLAVFVTAASVGGTVGAFVPYAAFARAGGEGSWIRDRIDVPAERIERGRDWFRRWGQSSVLWGRFVPVLRSVISIPAGLAKMHPLWFGLSTAAGNAGFYAAVGALVYYGRRQSVVVAAVDVAADRPVLAAVASLALVGLLLLVGTRFRRRRRRR